MLRLSLIFASAVNAAAGVGLASLWYKFRHNEGMPIVVLFVALGALLPIVALGKSSAPEWTLPIVAALACFIGALPLGVLQRYALPVVRGAWSFPLATMLGAAALSPLVLAIIGAPLGSPPLVGALGGLGYGLATATALGRAYAAPPRRSIEKA